MSLSTASGEWTLRVLALAALALAAIWFGLVDNDWADRRPVQRLLFIGHSRTYYNDMPAMVAKMADSAGSPTRYEISMQAFAGATAKSHWKNRKTQKVLADGHWDRLILQPDYVWRNDEPSSSGLFIYGTQILAKGATKSQPAVISDWTFRDDFYGRYNWNRAEHFEKSESAYRGLAYQTGAQLIDVARVWEIVRDEELPFSLYKDDDHPTLQGSFLVALVVYASISGSDVGGVTYVPWGMSNKDAAVLRERVKAALNANS